MERSSPLPPPLFPFHGTCGFHRLIPRHGDEGIQRGIVGFNALEQLAVSSTGETVLRRTSSEASFSVRYARSCDSPNAGFRVIPAAVTVVNARKLLRLRRSRSISITPVT